MKNGLLAVLASIGFGASVASAQLRPMPPDPYDAQQAAQAAAAPVVNPYPQPAYPATNDFPSAEVQAVPVARARAAVTRAQYQLAQSTVYRVVNLLKEDFEYSTEFAAAVRAEKTAYDHFITVRGHVLAQVGSNQEYRTLQNLCKDLNERLYGLKAHPAANKAEIVATAQLKLAYATKLSEIENDALRADSTTQDAKTKLVGASGKVSDMRAKFQRGVKRDQQFVSARKEMDDAYVAKVGAGAFFVGAMDAQDIALDYALYLHRHDPYTYRYNPTYSTYGYGYDSGITYGSVNYGYGTPVIYNPINRGFRGR